MARRKEHRYAFPRPAVTVDVAVFAAGEPRADAISPLKVLLIRRSKDPFGGSWALPGGFVDQDEDLVEAARRELEEETGLAAKLGPQLGTYGTPKRDPRGHTISVVYLAWLVGEPASVRGMDDALDARWHLARKPPKLAFDHRIVLRDAVAKLAEHASMPAELGGVAAMMPQRFRCAEAADFVAAALGEARTAALLARVRRGLRRDSSLRELDQESGEALFRKSGRTGAR